MDEPLSLAILALAGLVVGIVALAKQTGLKASLDELKRRLTALEGGGDGCEVGASLERDDRLEPRVRRRDVVESYGELRYTMGEGC